MGLALLGLIWLGLHLAKPKAPPPVTPAPPIPSAPAAPVIVPSATPRPLLAGEKILTGYADPAQPPRQDLILMHRCLDTFLLAAKGMKNQPLSANGEIAAALRGEGLVRLAFLPRGHPVFDATGQLIDRWKSPLFFHAEAAGVMAIRSAGPDKTLWTDDDLERKPNGTFHTGLPARSP